MGILKLTSTIFSLAILLLVLFSCNDKQTTTALGTTILDTMSNDKLLNGGTRTYNESAETSEEKVSFTIIHNGDLTQMTSEKGSNFKALMDSHGLTVESSFEIDAENKGVVLVPSSKLMTPIEIGKELSMVNEVLMVEVGGTKKTGSVS